MVDPFVGDKDQNEGKIILEETISTTMNQPTSTSSYGQGTLPRNRNGRFEFGSTSTGRYDDPENTMGIDKGRSSSNKAGRPTSRRITSATRIRQAQSGDLSHININPLPPNNSQQSQKQVGSSSITTNEIFPPKPPSSAQQPKPRKIMLTGVTKNERSQLTNVTKRSEGKEQKTSLVIARAIKLETDEQSSITTQGEDEAVRKNYESLHLSQLNPSLEQQEESKRGTSTTTTSTPVKDQDNQLLAKTVRRSSFAQGDPTSNKDKTTEKINASKLRRPTSRGRRRTLGDNPSTTENFPNSQLVTLKQRSTTSTNIKASQSSSNNVSPNLKSSKQEGSISPSTVRRKSVSINMKNSPRESSSKNSKIVDNTSKNTETSRSTASNSNNNNNKVAGSTSMLRTSFHGVKNPTAIRPNKQLSFSETSLNSNKNSSIYRKEVISTRASRSNSLGSSISSLSSHNYSGISSSNSSQKKNIKMPQTANNPPSFNSSTATNSPRPSLSNKSGSKTSTKSTRSSTSRNITTPGKSTSLDNSNEGTIKRTVTSKSVSSHSNRPTSATGLSKKSSKKELTLIKTPSSSSHISSPKTPIKPSTNGLQNTKNSRVKDGSSSLSISQSRSSRSTSSPITTGVPKKKTSSNSNGPSHTPKSQSSVGKGKVLKGKESLTGSGSTHESGRTGLCATSTSGTTTKKKSSPKPKIPTKKKKDETDDIGSKVDRNQEERDQTTKEEDAKDTLSLENNNSILSTTMEPQESVLKQVESQTSTSIDESIFGSENGMEVDYASRYPYSNTPLSSIVLKFTATTHVGCATNPGVPSYITVAVDQSLNIAKDNSEKYFTEINVDESNEKDVGFKALNMPLDETLLSGTHALVACLDDDCIRDGKYSDKELLHGTLKAKQKSSKDKSFYLINNTRLPPNLQERIVYSPRDKLLSNVNNFSMGKHTQQYSTFGCGVKIGLGLGISGTEQTDLDQFLCPLYAGCVFSTGASIFLIIQIIYEEDLVDTASHGPELKLDVIEGVEKGLKNISVGVKGASIGRYPDNDIAIADSEMSRYHSYISYNKEKKSFYLHDKGSTNGTYIHLNGFYAQSPYKLKLGDSIIVGRTGFSINRYDYEIAEDKGTRNSMEDKSIFIQDLGIGLGIDQVRLSSVLSTSVIPSVVPVFSAALRQENKEKYFNTSPLIGLISELCGYVRPLAPQTLVGVFDGHNGDAASSFLANHLPLIISKYIETTLMKFMKEDLKTQLYPFEVGHNSNALRQLLKKTIRKLIKVAIVEAFHRLDDTFLQDKSTTAGSTCTMALIIGNIIYVANTGDSRTIIVEQTSCESNNRSSFYTSSTIVPSGKPVNDPLSFSVSSLSSADGGSTYSETIRSLSDSDLEQLQQPQVEQSFDLKNSTNFDDENWLIQQRKAMDTGGNLHGHDPYLFSFLEEESCLADEGVEEEVRKEGIVATVQAEYISHKHLMQPGQGGNDIKTSRKPNHMKTVKYYATLDHKAKKSAVATESERKRVANFIVFDRLLGILAITRAFGDREIKEMDVQNLLQTKKTEADSMDGSTQKIVNPLICTPDISSFILKPNMDFILLASDGLYDVFTNEEVISIVYKEMHEHQDTFRCTQCIVEKCRQSPLGTDNLSISLVILRPWWEDKK